ncbi:MAG TPA: hypothetical protein VK837_09725 [Longimicrobiales bacterium]|nr:hypothetical protein [Longimicrobiales bacterium]
MPSRHAATMMLTGIVCALQPGCGSAVAPPVQLVGSPAYAPNLVEVDGAHFRVALGAEWVQLAVENLSDDTLRLDVDGVVFRDPSGLGHRLVPAADLVRFEARDESQPIPGAPVWRRVPAAPAPLLGHRPDNPAAKRFPLKRPPVRIAPGAAYEEYFYPAEHLNTTREGAWSAGPLFCSYRAGRVPPGSWFGIAVPLEGAGEVRRVHLEGRTAAR